MRCWRLLCRRRCAICRASRRVCTRKHHEQFRADLPSGVCATPHGQIGAAVVLFRDGVDCGLLRKHLDGQEHHTLFKAGLIKAEGHVWSATIGVDSQATVLATTCGRGAPGQYLTTGFLQQIAVVWHKHPSIEIKVRWTLVTKAYQEMRGWMRKQRGQLRGVRVRQGSYPGCAVRSSRSADQPHVRTTG